MEVINANVIFGKAGDNASKNSYTCKISFPKSWVDRMGLNPERREVQLSFDGDNIMLQRIEGSQIKQVPLASKNKIRRFALVWQQMYKNYSSIPFYYFDDVEFMGEELADLGVEMDSGESLKAAFPGVDAFNDNAALKRILNHVDVRTLGNAIFSQWRYWNHWSNSPMEEADYNWFVIALSKLAELAK